MNNLGLWLTKKTMGHKFWALDSVNNSELWMTLMTPGHELKALDTMNIMVDLKNLGSLAGGFRCYEHVRVMDDMNKLRSHELKPLDTMNFSRLWTI